MEYITFAGIGVLAAVLALVLKQHRAEYGLLLSISAGVMLLMFAMKYVSQITGFIERVSSSLSLPREFIPVLFKALGIAYLTQFASDACADAGETALAGKIELIGKCSMLVVSLPVLEELLDIILSII